MANHHPQEIDRTYVERERSRIGRWRVFDLKPPENRLGMRGEWMDRVETVYVSSVYLVQRSHAMVMADGRRVLTLAVRRINEREIVDSWSGMASIVSEIMGEGVWAVEMYPPARRLSCAAPMRWFWVFPDGEEPLPVGLHRHEIVGEMMEAAP